MPYAFKAPKHHRMTTHIPLPARLFLLLAALALAASASGQNTFNARITITSQCNTQQALFGPQADHNVTVICQPGMTPYQKEFFDLDDTDPDQDKATGNAPLQQGPGPSGTAAFSKPSSKKVLSPPLPSASIFASKVVFVVF